MDTQYTQGFKAGVAWREAEILKLLEDSMAKCSENRKPEGCVACYGQRDAIELIKGEQK